jgi:thiamine biosynthesis protein ThiS
MEPLETVTIEIVLNGEPRRVPAGLSLDHLLVFLEVDPSRVAVERNREIVRKPSWSETSVEPGDQIEVVWFVGGGCQ